MQTTPRHWIECYVEQGFWGREILATLSDITAHRSGKGVAQLKWPERLALVEALPRNPLNKIL
ncbi:MAG: hypothetical protein ACI9QQ_002901 [Myxococcota bacterium]|jgi:hypothetical protein